MVASTPGCFGRHQKARWNRPFSKSWRKWGPIPLGEARLTGPGKLPFKAIIHVAGINGWWRASEYSIRESVKSALAMAQEENYESIAFPLIGGHSGGFNPERSKKIILEELEASGSSLEMVVVEFQKSSAAQS